MIRLNIFALLVFSLSGIETVKAQLNIYEEDGVKVIDNYWSYKVSPDGNQSAGFTNQTDLRYYNNLTGESFTYAGCSLGLGYVISNEGIVVGYDNTNSEKAAILEQGKIYYPAVFDTYEGSNIHSITPDGRRICGNIYNGGNIWSVPFYCDITSEGIVGIPQFLPIPDADFFGNTPQYCTATWMSEDGNIILGEVADYLGQFFYPIIYRQDNQGNWTYFFPSEPLFNPTHLPIPELPSENAVSLPDPSDYMSESQREAWREALQYWENNNYDLDLQPNPLDFMTSEQSELYEEALKRYEDREELIKQYLREYKKIRESSVFFHHNAQALSSDGNWLAATAEIIIGDTELNDGKEEYVPYLYNFETGTWTKIEAENKELLSNQVTNSGDIILGTPAFASLPQSSWIYLNQRNETLSISDYVKEFNKTYYNWMENRLSYLSGGGVSEKFIPTGFVAASEDLSIIYGGVHGYSMDLDNDFSYIMTLDSIPAKEVYLNYQEYTLPVGDTFQLHAEIYPVNATDTKVVWISDNPEIATVSDMGLVKGVATGYVTIIATCGEASAFCQVTVIPSDEQEIPEVELPTPEDIIIKGNGSYDTGDVIKIRENNLLVLRVEEAKGGYPDGWVYEWQVNGSFIGDRPETITYATMPFGDYPEVYPNIYEVTIANFGPEGQEWAYETLNSELVYVYRRPLTPTRFLRKGNGTSCTFIVMYNNLSESELESRDYTYVYGYNDATGTPHILDTTQLRYSHTTPEIYNDSANTFWVYAIWKYDDGSIVSSGLRYLDGPEDEEFDASDFGGSRSIDGNDEMAGLFKITDSPDPAVETTVTIHSLSGTCVMNKVFAPGAEINLKSECNIQPGIYIVTIRNGQQSSICKMVIR